MSSKLLILIGIFFAWSGFISAQNLPVASVVHTRHTINSVVLGEERSILVRVPANYDRTGRKFPVIYMTDAHPPQNAMMAAVIEQQAWSGQIPELILVGIQNTNRTRDLTPTKVEGRETGGSERFLRFIETEVIPLVEKNYRTESFRIFAGHSLGGLFAVYSFVSRPDLFDAYIAASPDLDWDEDLVIKRAEEIFRQKKDWNKWMYLGIGNEPEFIKGFESFRKLLKKNNPKNFNYDFREFPDENHASVVLPSYYWGLRKVFEGWLPPPLGSVAELENHYTKLSKKYGYKIPVPENLMNQIGYQLLNTNRISEALEVFRKNVAVYPESANVYDSFGEALERNGQLKAARDNYEKAYKMAETQGDEQLARLAKANYERVLSKVK